jgi:protein-S-isoprenylcysteine O-methyltransferase Ste14
MYVGMTFVLIGWAVFLANIHSIWGPIFFILFLTRFQIIPEEKILTEKWGVLYINYCLQTRRWL